MKMYTIEKTGTKNKPCIEIEHKNIGLRAAINFTQGVKLKTLILDNMSIITEDKNLSYKESFTSAILFPFTKYKNH